MQSFGASARLSKWGLVQGWLAANPLRAVTVRAVRGGLEVTVTDPTLGEHRTEIGPGEDPSQAAWRAVIALDQG